MVGWHYSLSGHESEQTLGDGEGQGSLVCCSPQGHKESDMTKQLSNNNNIWKREKIWHLSGMCQTEWLSMW